MPRPSLALFAALLAGCYAGGAGQSASDSSGAGASTGTGASSSTTTTTASTASTTAAPTSGVTDGGTGTDGSTSGTKFDLPVKDIGGPPGPTCKVTGLDAVGPCVDKAPADSFAPVLEWAWVGQAGEDKSVTIPLVANLTDDDANGAIDLCDVPDVVMLAWTHYVDTPGHLYVIDGATGTTHFRIEHPIFPRVTPALGDIDGDGVAELLAVDMSGALVAFEHDGALKWASPPLGTLFQMFELAIAVADLQGDGAPEILLGRWVVNNAGAPLLTLDDEINPFDFISGTAVTAADLDGDGDLEIVLGRSAFHHDGAVYYKRAELQPGYPHVADLDGDAQPEVLLMHGAGPTILEHDGATKLLGAAFNDSRKWARPAAIHSFAGGDPGFLASSGANLMRYDAAAAPVWTVPVSDWSGISGSTAFDFLGDGTAEALYSDEKNGFTYDGATGAVLQTVARTSWTGNEYPVVADVDNDGSAEFLVVSCKNQYDMHDGVALQVFGDAESRWIPARRIWNQHTYHVTNVREDGTIPPVEPKHWQALNTFRTQAQITLGGSVCLPTPPG